MGSVSPVAASVTLPCTTCATALPVSRRQSRENMKSLCLNTCPNDFISSCKVTNNPRIALYPHPNITTMPSNGTAKGRPQSTHIWILWQTEIIPEAHRNLRLQSLDGRTKPLDGHPKTAYVHQKPANGDFTIASRKLSGTFRDDFLVVKETKHVA